jgi:chromosome segregation ATPase
VSDQDACSVCCRLTGFGDEDKGEPPVNLARCPAPGGMECRAVAQAVAPWRRENETLRANCDHLSSENASLASRVESMGLRIESLAEELAKPEDVRLREVSDALDGRAVIFDGLGARVGRLLDELDEWIARAGEAERTVEAARRSLFSVAESMTEHAYQELASALEAPPRRDL